MFNMSNLEALNELVKEMNERRNEENVIDELKSGMKEGRNE